MTDPTVDTPDEADGADDTDEPLAQESPADAAEAALRKVRDPDAGVSVFEAGVIEDVEVADGTATITADLREFPRDAAERVSAAMVQAVSDARGVSNARVEGADPKPDLDGRSSGIETADRVIAVASTKGGVGKTTVATTLACALAAGNSDSQDTPSVGLFDADIYGPNVPEVIGASGPVYSDDDGNPVPVDAGGLEVMSMALLSDDGPLAWRGAMAHDALSDLFETTAWSGPDSVVVDMPPGTGDVTLTTLQEVPVDGVVLVTTPFHAAVSDTARALELFEENDVPVLGVVSNMGEFVCDECGTPHDLFGGDDPIEALELPVLAELPFDPELQSTPAPSADALPEYATELAAAIDERYEAVWSVDPPADAVDLRGLDPETRKERVEKRFRELGSGEECFIVSDRDPTPVRGFLLDLTDAEELPSFRVKRQNPETWFARATRS
ncbi:P-loop NTPase [Halorubrum sp. Eb13]|uniref:P-loop NTPase n=1 Tax=Halorubrum sp. Eb13 TaxID=1383843 RepID=UPI000B99603D|nr:P-loop NTPase [Halorubrum sp. Eb13]OYR39482.1 ATP-binding protein [Halorubrum sp. Eb13]